MKNDTIVALSTPPGKAGAGSYLGIKLVIMLVFSIAPTTFSCLI